jgi:hypothetical protein
MTMKIIILKIVVLALVAIAVYSGCDRRNQVTRIRQGATFSVEMIAVKDYSQRSDIAQLQFKRDGVTFDDAIIAIGADTLQSNGGGIYVAQSPLLRLINQTNTVSFSVATDVYTSALTFDLPDSFGIISVNPLFNPDAGNVQVQWSRPGHTYWFILSVIGRHSASNNSTPHSVLLSSSVNNYQIPYTAFQDPNGFKVPDTYLIYITAFNQGFGSYPGMPFTIPTGLISRSVSDPVGHLRYGTVAPYDSVIVPI